MRPFGKLKFLYKKAHTPFRKVSLYIKERLGWLGDPLVIGYIGFGNRREVFLKGRVLENQGLLHPEETKTIWQNAGTMIKRYMSSEIPGVQVRGTLYGVSLKTETKGDGTFDFHFKFDPPLPEDTPWFKVKLELLDRITDDQKHTESEADVMIYQDYSQYGVISDIDDTIMVSYAKSTLKKLKLMLFRNAYTRVPFEGVAAFYRSLHYNGYNGSINPIFFISSGEWNLYDLLLDFLKHKNIPKGPFLLNSLKSNLWKLWKSGKGKHEHKLNKIRHVMTTFHDLKFIFIGDSGQKDPEIYAQIVNEFPDRMLAIYIRDVSSDSRHQEVKEIALELRNKGVPMLLVKDTEASALHAIDNGFIKGDTLIDIARERYRDQYLKEKDDL